MITPSCAFHGYDRRDFSKTTRPISIKFGTDSVITFERSRSKFKVNIAVLNIFQLEQLGYGLRYLHPSSATQQKQFTHGI